MKSGRVDLLVERTTEREDGYCVKRFGVNESNGY